MKPLKLPVKQAFVHQALVWPGAKANGEKSLHKSPATKIFLTEHGLLLEEKGVLTNCLIPMPNVVNMIIDVVAKESKVD